MSEVLRAMRQVVGEANVLTGGDLSAWEVDWRKRNRGRALAVVRPGDTPQVAAVVAACAQAGVAIVPQGGNTGLTGASIPDDSRSQVVLSLARLNRVREIDPLNLTLTADAGCVLQAVQDAATGAGLLFPLSLAAEGSCTIGGNLATNAGGTQVLRYGNARDLCLGVEVVTPDGQVWNGLTGLRKDNTGYDLRDLYIGSEGTLGVITAATLKLYPAPRATLTALAACPTLESASRLLERARSHAGDLLTGCEVMGAFALELVRRHFAQLPAPLPPSPWTVLLELSGSQDEARVRETLEELLAAALDAGDAGDAAIASSIEQSRSMWHLREAIPLAQAAEGHNVKHDISLPVSRIPAFVASTDAALVAALPGIRLVNFGHLGDGNLHYNVQGPPGEAADDFLRLHEKAINTIVYDAVDAHGGSISAEHGIGATKRDELARRKSPVALGIMKAIKQALDPRNTMNPGRML